jgi:hypothetical protein
MQRPGFRIWLASTAVTLAAATGLIVAGAIEVATWPQTKPATLRQLSGVRKFIRVGACEVEHDGALRCNSTRGVLCHRLIRGRSGEAVALNGGSFHRHLVGASVCHVP